MMKNIKNKTVLVTGAGGSIGSQICREILKIKPKILLILDSNEYSLYSILNDLNFLNNNKPIEIIPLLASVQDGDKIKTI